jgi:hypothetical protein
MKKKLKVEEVQELLENEEFVSDDDVDIEVSLDEEDNSVYVRFSGFSDSEDAEEYASMLANTLPLLLFESTRLQ